MKDHLGKSVKAIIFDMDGVLVDSEYWWPVVEDEYFATIIPEWDPEIMQQIIGKSIQDICAFLKTEHVISITHEELLNWYDTAAQDIYQKKVSLMPQAQKVLNQLKTRGMPMALASSARKSWIQMVVDRFRFDRFFSTFISSEDVGFVGKPSPDIFLHTARQLGRYPNECMVVEDSAHGVEAGKRAGMYVVGYRTPYNAHQNISAAHAVVEDLMEITNLINAF